MGVPLVAMKGGIDLQKYVDVLLPAAPATIKIVQGNGPVHLVGSHCVEKMLEEEEREDEAEEEESQEDDEDEKAANKEKDAARGPQAVPLLNPLYPLEIYSILTKK